MSSRTYPGKSGLDLLKESAGKILGERSKLENELFMNKNYPLLIFWRRIKVSNKLYLTSKDTRFLTLFCRTILIMTGFHLKHQIKGENGKLKNIELGKMKTDTYIEWSGCKIIEEQIINEGRWKKLEEIDDVIGLIAYLEKEKLIPKDGIIRKSFTEKIKKPDK